MLRVGIIGSGFGVYGLLPAFALTKNCHVTCICAEKSERLLRYSKKFNVKKIYSDWQLLLDKEKIDAVAIAVTPDLQYLVAKKAIKRGRHIFAEKPLALNYKQALDIYNLAKKHKIVTSVDFIFPEIPEWIKVKELLRKEILGKLLYIKIDWDFLSYDIEYGIKSWKTDVKRGGGALSFYFSHVLYYLENFIGEIKEFSSILSASPKSLNGGEVGVDLIFKSKSGVKGNAHLNCCAFGIKKHSLFFLCENGSILLENNKNVIGDFTIRVNRYNKSKNLKVNRVVLPEGWDERVGAVKNIAERFVYGCLHKKQVSPSVEDGLRVQKLIGKLRNEFTIKD